MTPEQEQKLFEDIGGIKVGLAEVHYRINRVLDDVDDAKKETARCREAVDSYAANTVTRIIALEQASEPKADTGATNREDREALEIGRTVKGIPKLLAVTRKNLQAIVLFALACLIAYREFRGQPTEGLRERGRRAFAVASEDSTPAPRHRNIPTAMP